MAFHPTQDPISSVDGSCHALGTGNKQGYATAAVAFSCKDYGAADLNPTLRAMGHDGSHANAGGQVAIAFSVTGPLSANGGTSRKHGFGMGQQDWENGFAQPHGSAVRRLTPVECERLQGFPDNYTAIPYRNGTAADGPRYKALGNSMAVPVVRWIGRRIKAVHEENKELSEILGFSVPELHKFIKSEHKT